MTGSLASGDDGAFRYRGADLRPAVERVLFNALAADSELMGAFAAAGRGESARVPAYGSELATLVAGATLGTAPQALASAPRRLATRARRALHTARDRRSALERHPPASPSGPVCFVLDHPKYARFVAPVIAELEGPALVVGTSAGPGIDTVFDVPGSDATLRARALGHGLWHSRHLAAGFDALHELLAGLEPRRVIVVEGGGPIDELANAAAHALRVPSVCLQQGWSPVVHSGFRRMSCDRMAVWGEGFRDLLAPFNPGLDFAVTGNPALGGGPASGRLAAELDGRPAVAFFLQSTSAWIQPSDLDLMYELVRRAADRHPRAAVLVREHPGAPLGAAEREALGARANVRLVPASEWSLREVLDATSVAVSIYSTSLLEAAALGVPAVVFNPTSVPPLEPDLEALGAGLRAADVAGALEALDRLVAPVNGRAGLEAGSAAVRDRYFAGARPGAAGRMARAIETATGPLR